MGHPRSRFFWAFAGGGSNDPFLATSVPPPQWVPYSVSALSNKGLAGQQSLLREVLTCVLQGSPLLLLSIPPPSLAPLSAWGDKGVRKPGTGGWLSSCKTGTLWVVWTFPFITLMDPLGQAAQHA